MKNKPLIAFLMLLFAQSCVKKLDERPDNFIAPVNFYKNPADAIAAINAVYDPLSAWGAYEREIYLMTELSTDNMDLSGRNQERAQLDDYLIDASNNVILNTWSNFFNGINRANTVSDRIPQVSSVPSALRLRIEGEARFLRAFYYFNLVRLFGDVPLIIKETSSLQGLNVTRNSVSDVYVQIIKDLEFAEQNLPLSYSGADVGRITKGAAKTLLAKVYLTMAGHPLKDASKYELAGKKAKEVIELQQYNLLSRYEDNFAIALKNGKESIFEGQSVANSLGNDVSRIYTNFAPQPQNPYGQRAYGGFFPSLELYNSYEVPDARKRLYLTESYTTPGGAKVTVSRPHINKYIDPAGSENNNSNNWPYLRYADVLLMYAEAMNETGKPAEAITYINMIRNRVGLLNTTASTQGQLRDVIEKERRLELAFEGHRWFDLVRTGKLISTMIAKGKTAIKNFHVLYPIPQRERDVNPNLTQNAGY